MRLFIAVNFSENVKKKISEISSGIRKKVSDGNMTASENYHLTLAFLGEVADTRQRCVEKAMENVFFAPFNLTLKGVGRFRRNGGDIVWIGIEKTQSLTALHQNLSEELTAAGFDLDQKEFRPHLTLGRKVRAADRVWEEIEKASEASEIAISVKKISLMKSERIAGKLTYTEIFSKKATIPDETKNAALPHC